jgi:peptidoglycan/LPS O-acetylase OafA/YrhL
MNRATSLYLDAVRFIAAFSVFAFHLFQPDVAHFADFGFRLSVGRESVIIFFVLSGFVIAYVHDNRENSPTSYFISRFSRLYSVVTPAILITIILDYFGNQLDSEIYTDSAHEDGLLRVGISLLYLNQIWNFTVSAFSNAPYWSVSYEFWYYMLFGAMVFLSGYKKYLVAFMILTLVGPRITIMSSIWLLGVAAYYIGKNCEYVINKLFLLFPLSLISLFILHFYFNPGSIISRLFFSLLDEGRFLHVFSAKLFIGGDYEMPSDFVFAAVFAISIVTSSAFFSRFNEVEKLSQLIRFAASYTFSMYLYHFPLLLFFHALLSNDAKSAPSVFLLIIATVSSVFLLGHFTERRKDIYVRLFTALFDRGNVIFTKCGSAGVGIR